MTKNPDIDRTTGLVEFTDKHQPRTSVLVAPRLNGDGFLAVVYRSQIIRTLAIPSLEVMVETVSPCLRDDFGMTEQSARDLAELALDRYVSRVVATDEAHSLTHDLQRQLRDAQHVIVALTEQLGTFHDGAP